MTAPIELHIMSEAEAHKVTEDIRHNAKSFTEYRARLMDAVDRAKRGSAHLALGYCSWTAYLSDVLGEEPMRLARGERQDMVRMLSDEGMSTRAIAPIVGAGMTTVKRDLKAPGPGGPPEPYVNRETGEIHEPTVDYQAEANKIISSVAKGEPQKITGMDGKTYSRPEPPKPRAEAVTKQFTSAVADLNRILDKFHRITASQNFQANKNQVATLHGNDLARAISELESIADQLT